jgi:hypothetical protein
MAWKPNILERAVASPDAAELTKVGAASVRITARPEPSLAAIAALDAAVQSPTKTWPRAHRALRPSKKGNAKLSELVDVPAGSGLRIC